jgi:selenoprotein W-related protein
LADTLITTFRPNVSEPHPISELALLPSSGGRFEVSVDGELVYSKAATGKHADPAEVVEAVRARLAQPG